MTEHGPFMVHRLLQYCYLLRYDDEPLSLDGINETSTSKLCTNVHMYKMGEYYDLQGMKLDALNKTKKYLEVFRDPKAELAEQVVANVLEVLPQIYSSTSELDCIMQNRAAFFAYCYWGTFVAHPDFEEIAAENIKWVIDIISLKRNQEPKTSQPSDPGFPASRW